MSRRKIDDDLGDDVLPSQEDNKQVEKNLSQADYNDMLFEAANLKGEAAIEKAIDALSNGADLNARVGPRGPNIFYLAASNDNQELFDWLLEVKQGGKGVEVDYIMSDDVHYFSSLLRENISVHMLGKIIDNFDFDLDLIDKQGNTPLMRSLFANNYHVVNLLLEKGANPSQKLRRSNVTALLFAASECFADVVEPLLKAGADVSAVDSDGHNALMVALLREPSTLPKSKRDSLIKAIHLLVDAPGMAVNIESSGGIQPLFSIMHREGYEDIFDKLIDKGADVNAKYDDGYRGNGLETPLHYAARLGKINYVEKLLNAGAKLSVPDGFGVSPESYLMLNEETRPHFLKLILDGEAQYDPNAIWAERDKANEFDNKALKKSTVFNLLLLENAFSPSEDPMQQKMTDLLLKHMMDNGLKKTLINEPDVHSAEPLFTVMSLLNKDFFNTFLDEAKKDKNFNINNVFNIGGKYTPNNQTYLSYLMTESDVMTSMKLQAEFKDKLKESKNSVFKKGRTGALSQEEMEAKKKEIDEAVDKIKNEKKIVQDKILEMKLYIFDKLLENGADIGVPLTKENGSVLFKIKDGFWLKEFAKRGFDILPKDENGFTPLDVAIIKNSSLVETYKEITSIPENTLYKLAFYNYEKVKGNKEVSAQLGIVKSLFGEEDYKGFNKEQFDYVFKSKIPQVSYADEDGNTPLLVATANGVEFLSKMLINMGADLNATNANGETPLQYACANGMRDVANRLLDGGADPLAKNNEGFTAWDLANNSGLADIAKRIEESNKSRPKP